MKGRDVAELIDNAAAVIIMDDNNAVTYAGVEQVDDEEFWNIDLTYEVDGWTQDYTAKIWGDDDIRFEDNTIFLDFEGEEIGIKLLEIKKDMNTVRCNNCMWEGDDDDLVLVETLGDGQDTKVSVTHPSGLFKEYLPKPEESFYFKGCPKCEDDGCLMDLVNDDGIPWKDIID